MTHLLKMESPTEKKEASDEDEDVSYEEVEVTDSGSEEEGENGEEDEEEQGEIVSISHLGLRALLAHCRGQTRGVASQRVGGGGGHQQQLSDGHG